MKKCIHHSLGTMRGFGILIQKEWLAFGHKFEERIGHGQSDDSAQQAPIFVQFIGIVAEFPSYSLKIYQNCRYGVSNSLAVSELV